jgi:putative effector of murein hydrolase LrgA (UPF0299 family)
MAFFLWLNKGNANQLLVDLSTVYVPDGVGVIN